MTKEIDCKLTSRWVTIRYEVVTLPGMAAANETGFSCLDKSRAICDPKCVYMGGGIFGLDPETGERAQQR